jgi:hypothetical protein
LQRGGYRESTLRSNKVWTGQFIGFTDPTIILNVSKITLTFGDAPAMTFERWVTGKSWLHRKPTHQNKTSFLFGIIDSTRGQLSDCQDVSDPGLLRCLHPFVRPDPNPVCIIVSL